MTETYEVWLGKVREALEAADAVLSANRFWWSEQVKSLKQNCEAAPDCWRARGHQGDCGSTMKSSSPC